ncbi:helix-turn-helix domain-containing protein [Microbacterium sp. 2P01SA-2]|uniref:helix-turn-helix domain-containing protein n=1 Tax=unclassified Microbacterium TaxID=2609290 RepID=UPI0039A18EAE
MSVEAMAVVLHHSAASGTAKLVLLGIANHEGDGGAWPTINTLAKYANTDPRTVQRAIEKLIELGELKRQMQQGGDHRIRASQRPNLYRITVVCPEDCDRTTRHAPVDKSRQAGVTPVSPGDAHATRGVTPVSPKPSLNHPSHSDTAERQVPNRASGHRHQFDPSSGYCGCGYRDDGRLVDPKTGRQFQPPAAQRENQS